MDCAANRLRGFNCARCGHALFTHTTVRSAKGVITRYRRCENPACRARRTVVTEERPRTLLRGRKRGRTPPD